MEDELDFNKETAASVYEDDDNPTRFIIKVRNRVSVGRRDSISKKKRILLNEYKEGEITQAELRVQLGILNKE